MKKGFFLLAAMASLFQHNSYGGIGIDKVNKMLDGSPSRSSGGKPSKRVWKIMDKKRKLRNHKSRIAKKSRSINRKKAA